MFATQFPDGAHHVLVIDNSLGESHRADLDRGVELIGGSNWRAQIRPRVGAKLARILA
jgi:hypothetical protein